MTNVIRQENCARRMSRCLLALVFVFSGVQTKGQAAPLKPETLASWKIYVSEASARMNDRLQPGAPFLRVDEKPEVLKTVRDGTRFVSPLDQSPRKVPGGLIHDWIGATFIPNTDVDKVLSLMRDYQHYKDIYNPAVIDSRLLQRTGSRDRFSVRLANRALLSKTALDGVFECSYVRVDDSRWYSISEATRFQEIENYGTPEQHLLAENEGSGFIWRLMTIDRFEERDGGVYLEMEVIALSRDIPASLRWIVTPIVRRVSKASLLASLQQTSDAVSARSTVAVQIPGPLKPFPIPDMSATFNQVKSLR